MKNASFIYLFLLSFLRFDAEAGAGPETALAAAPVATDKSLENASRHEPSGQVAAWSIDAGRLGLLKQIGPLLGKPVKDRNEKTVGKIEDLILDLAEGKAVAVLVSSGVAGQVTPVPAQSFAAVLKDKFVLRTNRQVFEAAPQLSKVGPVASLPSASLDASFRHFGQHQSPRSAGQFCSAAALLGARLNDQDHQLLGQLKDMMVDVPAGRIVYLVVEPSDNLGQRGEFYVVPPIRVEAEAAGGLVLKTGAEHFSAGPHFPRDFWTDMAFPEMAAAMCKHYHVTPGAHPIASLAAGGESPASSSPSTPPPSDEQITQAVLAQIVQGGGDSAKLSIVVTTMKGRVTLSGTVRNEKQKKLVTEAAERVAGAANVEDRLEIWGKPRTAQL